MVVARDGLVPAKHAAMTGPAAAIVGILGLIGAAPASAEPAVCKTSFDPYKATVAQQEACGFKRFPRQSTQHNSDGSTTYTYLLEGEDVIYRVPPTGFNFLTATPEQLKEYGI